MGVTPTPEADMTDALVVARTNQEIMARLDWLLHRALVAEEEIVALLRELKRRRASCPP
jgi:hypothetical protein